MLDDVEDEAATAGAMAADPQKIATISATPAPAPPQLLPVLKICLMMRDAGLYSSLMPVFTWKTLEQFVVELVAEEECCS